MPLASKYSHGIVKIGDGLNVTTDGLLTVDFNSDWYSGVKSDISNLRVDVNALRVNVDSNNDEIVKLNDYFERLRTNRIPISPVSGGFRAGSGASGLGISIGSDAKAAAYSVALGDRANANVWSVAIGNDSYSWGEDAVQLAQGRNSSEGTLQFRDFNIVDKAGKLYTNLGTETVVDMGLVASEQYVKDLLKTVTGGGLNLQVVDMLPTENISTSTIYLVPNDDGTYDEFVYVNEIWEQIGTTEVDLSNYVTLEEYNKLVNNETQIRDANGSFYAGGSYKGNKGIAIGPYSKVNGTYGVAIGLNANAGSYGVALGSSAASQTKATTRAIQLGEGINNTEKSLQVFNDNIYNAETHTLTVQNISLNGEDLATKLEGAGGVSQEDFDNVVNNTTQIKTRLNGFMAGGASSCGSNGVAIGIKANASNSGVAIGNGANDGLGYVAIGWNAKTTGSNAIQIGPGTNPTGNTLQVVGDNIYNYNTHTLTVQNIELNGVNLGTQLGDLNTALEAILGV